MPHPPDPDQPALAITGGNPSYRRGLVVGLADHGWTLDTVDDPKAWIHDPGRRILLVHLHQPDTAPALLGVPRPDHTRIVALAPDPVAEDYVALTRAGADAIAPADAEPAHIAGILDALVEGHALIALPTLYRLIAIARSQVDRPVLADDERRWLTELAHGRTVNEIATDDHRSTRAMHRALNGLYNRLGVGNRDQAVAWAARHGILDHD